MNLKLSLLPSDLDNGSICEEDAYVLNKIIGILRRPLIVGDHWQHTSPLSGRIQNPSSESELSAPRCKHQHINVIVTLQCNTPKTQRNASGHRVEQTDDLIMRVHYYEQQLGVVWLAGWLTRTAPSAETPVVGLTASA